MDILDKFNKYLKNRSSKFEEDMFTKEIIKEYYEEEKLRGQWKTALEKDFNLGYPTDDSTTQVGSADKKNNRLAILFIACLIGLMLIMYFANKNNIPEPSKIEQLLAEHYAEPISRDMVKSTEQSPLLIQEAYNHYQQKNYLKAIPLFEQIINEGNPDEDHRFFLGLSYQLSDSPEKASPHFEWILQQESSGRKDAATWYLALALVDAGQNQKARLYLETVSRWDNNNAKRKMAEDAKILLDHIGQ